MMRAEAPKATMARDIVFVHANVGVGVVRPAHSPASTCRVTVKGLNQKLSCGARRVRVTPSTRRCVTTTTQEQQARVNAEAPLDEALLPCMQINCFMMGTRMGSRSFFTMIMRNSS